MKSTRAMTGRENGEKPPPNDESAFGVGNHTPAAENVRFEPSMEHRVEQRTTPPCFSGQATSRAQPVPPPLQGRAPLHPRREVSRGSVASVAGNSHAGRPVPAPACVPVPCLVWDGSPRRADYIRSPAVTTKLNMARVQEISNREPEEGLGLVSGFGDGWVEGFGEAGLAGLVGLAVKGETPGLGVGFGVGLGLGPPGGPGWMLTPTSNDSVKLHLELYRFSTTVTLPWMSCSSVGIEKCLVWSQTVGRLAGPWSTTTPQATGWPVALCMTNA